MIKIWQFLLHGYWHKWGKPYGKQTDHYDISFGRRSYMYTTQAVCCEKCGRSVNMKVGQE